MPDGEDEDAPSDAEEAEVPRHVQKYAHKLPVADEFQSRMLRRGDGVDLLLPAATAAHSQGVADNVLASLHYNTLARGSVTYRHLAEIPLDKNEGQGPEPHETRGETEK